MRCPGQGQAQTGPTRLAGDTTSAPAAYVRADRPDTGRLAHPRAPRMPSGPRPLLGYRVGGWTWPHDSGHIWEALSPHPSCLEIGVTFQIKWRGFLHIIWRDGERRLRLPTPREVQE